MILYPFEMQNEMLSSKDGNGCHLKKWNENHSDIVDTTIDERKKEHESILMEKSDGRGILLKKRMGNRIVDRTEDEIQSDIEDYKSMHFNYQEFIKDVFSDIGMVRMMDLGSLTSLMREVGFQHNWKNMGIMLRESVNRKIISIEEFEKIKSRFSEQDILI